jgi:hypothetical protein
MFTAVVQQPPQWIWAILIALIVPVAMFNAILQQTPPWVWVVLIALIIRGFKQTMPRRRTLRSSTVLPLVMVALSFYGVTSVFSLQPLALVAWVCGATVTLLLAQTLQVWRGIRWVPQEQAVWMPGSWLPLVLMLGIFCIKFGVAVSLAADPDLALDRAFAGMAGLVYGSFSGMFLSRAMAVWRAARQ